MMNKEVIEQRNELLRRFAASRRKPVIQKSVYTEFPIRYYDSLLQAEKETGIDRTSIKHCCDGKYTRAGLYLWSWA